jgi:hypothetical protein
MKRSVNVASVSKHLPQGLALPARFEELVLAARDPSKGGHFDIGWRDPRKLHHSIVMRRLGVFMTLPDGGVVALWASGEAPPVVHVDSEGGARVVARDFDDFLSRLARRKTGMPDLDAVEEDTAPLALPAGAAPRSFATIAKAFARALAEGEPVARTGDDVEPARAALVELATAMVRDGLLRWDMTRMAEPSDDWNVRLRVTRSDEGWTFEHRNEAAWHALPERYGMAPLWERVRKLCKRPEASTFDLHVQRRGLVSIDRDKQLVALPGGMKLSEYLARMQAEMLSRAGST